MQDYSIRVVSPVSGIEMKLYKRGLEKLEQTRDANGVSLLDKLLYILDGIGAGSHTWADIEAYSAQGKEIWNTYYSVYFPQ